MSHAMAKPCSIIAIDGPASSGKSTVARAVAHKLGYIYVDTGAMYRAVALLAVRHHIQPDDVGGLLHIMQQYPLRLHAMPDNEPNKVFLADEDVSHALRAPEVNALVPHIAGHHKIRLQLIAMQREMAVHGSVVMDGRDIGTVVLPQADLKIFLVADIRERAKRRWQELKEKGHDVTLSTVQAELVARDRQDKLRKHSPLQKAPDAIEIDTTGKTVVQVVHEIVTLCTSGGANAYKWPGSDNA